MHWLCRLLSTCCMIFPYRYQTQKRLIPRWRSEWDKQATEKSEELKMRPSYQWLWKESTTFNEIPHTRQGATGKPLRDESDIVSNYEVARGLVEPGNKITKREWKPTKDFKQSELSSLASAIVHWPPLYSLTKHARFCDLFPTPSFICLSEN